MKSVFALRDIKALAWIDPMFSPNVATMCRELQGLVDQGRIPSSHLADLELYEIGTFCQESGRLTPRDPKHIMCVGELINGSD